MRRSEAEGRFGEAEPEGCASIRLVLAPLRNHEIAIGCESVAAAPPSPRRPPCLPAFPAVARGAPTVRIARSARRLGATSLSLVRSASPARLPSASLRRIYPRLHVYLKAPHPLADTGRAA